MTLPDLNNIIIAKPTAYQGMEVGSAEALLKAGQRVLGLLETAVVERGYEQLKSRTGYTKEHLPDESPKATAPFVLDNITFEMYSTVRRTNPQYQTAYDKIVAFVENAAYDWKEKVQKRGIRTYDDAITGNPGPFVRWDYFMGRAYRYVGQYTELGVENKFAEITAPAEYDTQKLGQLVLPVKIIADFDINKPGAARVWYLARRFCEEVTQETVKPFKNEMERQAGEVEMSEYTKQCWKDIEKYLFTVQSVSSPRRQPGQALSQLLAIPERKKKKGDASLPVVVTENNYAHMLAEMGRPEVEKIVEGAKTLDGEIGELVTFHYGVDEHPRIRQELPFLPQYQIHKEEGAMFVSLQAIYDRMLALEHDFTKNRVLHRHSAMPLV